MKFHCFFPVIFIFTSGLSKYFENTTTSLLQWKLQDQNNSELVSSSSSCAIPETGFGSSPHLPVLSVCFSCFYTGIWDLLFNAGSERLLER